MSSIILLLILIALSGICYRLGGEGKKGDKLDFLRDTLTRDLGCPALAILILSLFFGWHGSYFLFFGLSWLALTTYWDWLFGYDNFYMHGFGCGVAGFALINSIPFWVIITRLIICTLGMGLWSKYVKTDVPQERGRGIFFII